MTSDNRIKEIIRFGIVGGVATVMQVVIYYLLSASMNHNLALVVSYTLSLIVNFLLTVHFTFQVKPTVKKGIGFLTSHAVNLTLQFVLLNLFVWIGVAKRLAIIPILAVCIPVNFLLIRYSMRKL